MTNNKINTVVQVFGVLILTILTYKITVFTAYSTDQIGAVSLVKNEAIDFIKSAAFQNDLLQEKHKLALKEYSISKGQNSNFVTNLSYVQLTFIFIGFLALGAGLSSIGNKLAKISNELIIIHGQNEKNSDLIQDICSASFPQLVDNSAQLSKNHGEGLSNTLEQLSYIVSLLEKREKVIHIEIPEEALRAPLVVNSPFEVNHYVLQVISGMPGYSSFNICFIALSFILIVYSFRKKNYLFTNVNIL